MRTTLPFGRLGYGAANVGNLYRELTDEQSHAILDAAWEAGIRYFDTAPHYGLGLSERRLGAFLRTKPRDEYLLSTKVGRLLRPHPEGAGTLDTDNDFHVPATTRRVWDASADGVRRSVDESLERLGLDRIDVLYLHDPERYGLDGALATAVPALAGLREEGVVCAVGVGSMSTDALLASAETGAIDLLMVAGRYTLVEQQVRPHVLDACARHGVRIVNASIFASGLLARAEVAADARYEYGPVPPDVLERARAIAAECVRFGTTLPAAALQYTLRDPLVCTVVVGASRPEQVRQSVDRAAEPIPDDLWAALHERGLVPAP
ncbi:aldo/keto reductase [Antribacter gilvus]|uniref:aldo/keto reductase n=1 Tax=Antribacter gilvus TaxID=2304675 RepID=UPI001982629D|nr:aldo/keto reductase [Antribacter gilvus]